MPLTPADVRRIAVQYGPGFGPGYDERKRVDAFLERGEV